MAASDAAAQPRRRPCAQVNFTHATSGRDAFRLAAFWAMLTRMLGFMASLRGGGTCEGKGTELKAEEGAERQSDPNFQRVPRPPLVSPPPHTFAAARCSRRAASSSGRTSSRDLPLRW